MSEGWNHWLKIAPPADAFIQVTAHEWRDENKRVHGTADRFSAWPKVGLYWMHTGIGRQG